MHTLKTVGIREFRENTVGIREFRENLADYTREQHPLQLTSYGRTVGYFIPAFSPNYVILCTQEKSDQEPR